MIFDTVLSVDTDVGCFWWTIFARDVQMDVNLWYFSNKPPNYTSVADTITFLIILHSTCTGTFSRGISYIGVLDFGSRILFLSDLLCASSSDM